MGKLKIFKELARRLNFVCKTKTTWFRNLKTEVQTRSWNTYHLKFLSINIGIEGSFTKEKQLNICIYHCSTHISLLTHLLGIDIEYFHTNLVLVLDHFQHYHSTLSWYWAQS